MEGRSTTLTRRFYNLGYEAGLTRNYFSGILLLEMSACPAVTPFEPSFPPHRAQYTYIHKRPSSHYDSGLHNSF